MFVGQFNLREYEIEYFSNQYILNSFNMKFEERRKIRNIALTTHLGGTYSMQFRLEDKYVCVYLYI